MWCSHQSQSLISLLEWHTSDGASEPSQSWSESTCSRCLTARLSSHRSISTNEDDSRLWPRSRCAIPRRYYLFLAYLPVFDRGHSTYRWESAALCAHLCLDSCYQCKKTATTSVTRTKAKQARILQYSGFESGRSD